MTQLTDVDFVAMQMIPQYICLKEVIQIIW